MGQTVGRPAWAPEQAPSGHDRTVAWPPPPPGVKTSAWTDSRGDVVGHAVGGDAETDTAGLHAVNGPGRTHAVWTAGHNKSDAGEPCPAGPSTPRARATTAAAQSAWKAHSPGCGSAPSRFWLIFAAAERPLDAVTIVETVYGRHLTLDTPVAAAAVGGEGVGKPPAVEVMSRSATQDTVPRVRPSPLFPTAPESTEDGDELSTSISDTGNEVASPDTMARLQRHLIKVVPPLTLAPDGGETVVPSTTAPPVGAAESNQSPAQQPAARTSTPQSIATKTGAAPQSARPGVAEATDSPRMSPSLDTSAAAMSTSLPTSPSVNRLRLRVSQRGSRAALGSRKSSTASAMAMTENPIGGVDESARRVAGAAPVKTAAVGAKRVEEVPRASSAVLTDTDREREQSGAPPSQQIHPTPSASTESLDRPSDGRASSSEATPGAATADDVFIMDDAEDVPVMARSSSHGGLMGNPRAEAPLATATAADGDSAYIPETAFSLATALPVSVATLYFADTEKRGLFSERSLASILHKWQRFRSECRKELSCKRKLRLRALKAAALLSASSVNCSGVLTLKSVRRYLEHMYVRRIYLGYNGPHADGRAHPEAATDLGSGVWASGGRDGEEEEEEEEEDEDEPAVSTEAANKHAADGSNVETLSGQSDADAPAWQISAAPKRLLPWDEGRLRDKFDQFDLGLIRRVRSWPTMGARDASAHVDHTAMMAGVLIERGAGSGLEHFDLNEAAVSLDAADRMLRHDMERLGQMLEDGPVERRQFSVWLLRLASGGRLRDDSMGCDDTGEPSAPSAPGASPVDIAEAYIRAGRIVELRSIAAVLRMFWEDGVDVFDVDFANRRHYYYAYTEAQTQEAFRELLDGIIESFSPPVTLSVRHRDNRHFLTSEEFMGLADLLTRMYVSQKNRTECVGKYEIGRLLGHGSEGRVHVARDLYSGVRYAIKIIRRGNCSEFARIDREIEAMKVVACHPNVIHLREVLESRRHVYIVMELCGGGSVHEFAYARMCQAGYPNAETATTTTTTSNVPLLTEPETRRLMRTLLETVAYCHAHGVSHRDLRLNNLMLLDDGTLKIADFGQVGLFSAGWDMFETNLIGSLYNMAPELIHGQVYQSTKVDVWSCGVILYWLLEGHPPFPQEDLNAMMASILQCQVAETVHASPAARDCIRRMLVPATERPEAAEVLTHPFFRGAAVASTVPVERPLRMDVRDLALMDAQLERHIREDGGASALACLSSVLSDGDIHFHPGLMLEKHRRCRWTLRCYWPEHDIKFSIALLSEEERVNGTVATTAGAVPAEVADRAADWLVAHDGRIEHRREGLADWECEQLAFTLSFRRRGSASLLFMRAVCKIVHRFYRRYRALVLRGAVVGEDSVHGGGGGGSSACEASGEGNARRCVAGVPDEARLSQPVRRLLHQLHLSSAASRRYTPGERSSPPTARLSENT